MKKKSTFIFLDTANRNQDENTSSDQFVPAMCGCYFNKIINRPFNILILQITENYMPMIFISSRTPDQYGRWFIYGSVQIEIRKYGAAPVFSLFISFPKLTSVKHLGWISYLFRQYWNIQWGKISFMLLLNFHIRTTRKQLLTLHI